jgi:hypothetical protein
VNFIGGGDDDTLTGGLGGDTFTALGGTGTLAGTAFTTGSAAQNTAAAHRLRQLERHAPLPTPLKTRDVSRCFAPEMKEYREDCVNDE